MIRTLLLGLVVVLVILIVVAIWLPDRISASHGQLISASDEQIYAVLSDLETLPEWSPWDGGAGPEDYTFSTPAQGAGAWAAWTNADPQSGSGDIRLLEADPDTALSLEVSFDEGASGEWLISLQPQDGGTQVTFEYASSLTEGAGPVYGLLLRYGRGLVERSLEEAMARGLAEIESGIAPDGVWRPQTSPTGN